MIYRRHLAQGVMETADVSCPSCGGVVRRENDVCIVAILAQALGSLSPKP